MKKKRYTEEQIIGFLREAANLARALGFAEVDRGGPLAAIGGKEVSGHPVLALPVPGRSPVTGVISDPRPFDLDDVRAQVGKQLRAPRAREHTRKVEDADTFQRLHARRRHGLRSARTALAALWPGAPVTPPPGCAPEPQR